MKGIDFFEKKRNGGFFMKYKVNTFRNRNYLVLLVIVLWMFNYAGLFAEEKLAKVYFSKKISSESVFSLYQRIMENVNGKVGIKVHFGEKGNPYYVKPELYKKLQNETRGSFVETNVIYPGPRKRTESHIALAKKHGFGYAPIHILNESGEYAISAKLNHFNEVWVGNDFKDYDTYIVCSHFKGHAMAGFGGAIKNVAMGLASGQGKTAMHASHYPVADIQKCIDCGICVQNCAESAISLNPLRIDPTKCIGCGNCIAECPVKALTNQAKSSGRRMFLEKLADYAKGISDKTNMVYINFVNNVSPDCDCSSHPDEPFIHDIGILASTDPVAIDKASLDLVNKAADSEDAFMHINTVSGNHQLNYGNEIGLGNIKYELIEID